MGPSLTFSTELFPMGEGAINREKIRRLTELEECDVETRGDGSWGETHILATPLVYGELDARSTEIRNAGGNIWKRKRVYGAARTANPSCLQGVTSTTSLLKIDGFLGRR